MLSANSLSCRARVNAAAPPAGRRFGSPAEAESRRRSRLGRAGGTLMFAPCLRSRSCRRLVGGHDSTPCRSSWLSDSRGQSVSSIYNRDSFTPSPLVEIVSPATLLHALTAGRESRQPRCITPSPLVEKESHHRDPLTGAGRESLAKTWRRRSRAPPSTAGRGHRRPLPLSPPHIT